jgi:hypothetical protein
MPRFWGHLPPETLAFIATFLSESVNPCSQSRHVECTYLIYDFRSDGRLQYSGENTAFFYARYEARISLRREKSG